MKRFTLCLASLVLAATSASAGILTNLFTNVTYSVAENWDPVGAPDGSTDVVFTNVTFWDGVAVSNRGTLTFTAVGRANSVTFASPGSAVVTNFFRTGNFAWLVYDSFNVATGTSQAVGLDFVQGDLFVTNSGGTAVLRTGGDGIAFFRPRGLTVDYWYASNNFSFAGASFIGTVNKGAYVNGDLGNDFTGTLILKSGSTSVWVNTRSNGNIGPRLHATNSVATFAPGGNADIRISNSNSRWDIADGSQVTVNARLIRFGTPSGLPVIIENSVIRVDTGSSQFRHQFGGAPQSRQPARGLRQFNRGHPEEPGNRLHRRISHGDRLGHVVQCVELQQPRDCGQQHAQSW
jgi:hypothetical protein